MESGEIVCALRIWNLEGERMRGSGVLADPLCNRHETRVPGACLHHDALGRQRKPSGQSKCGSGGRGACEDAVIEGPWTAHPGHEFCVVLECIARVRVDEYTGTMRD